MSLKSQDEMCKVIDGSDLPGSWIDDLDRTLKGQIPEERVQCALRQAQIARSLKFSERIQGVGQRVAEIDPRLYFRMLHAFGHHEGWLKDLQRDNPSLRAPGVGFKRRKGDFRHGITFLDGKPVGYGPHSEKGQ